ncbi:hypothetical protein [Marisediminicola sp. LYQ134]|uniref:hypothetical protein n=1 Tax=unclassified Marisediminicola TaxID=2618316 RepID=UPI00398328DD
MDVIVDEKKQPENPLVGGPRFKHDWFIDMSRGPTGVRDDPGVAVIAARIHPFVDSVTRVKEEGEELSQLIREAAARGVHRHVLAADLLLRLEVVDRILAGGSFFEIR